MPKEIATEAPAGTGFYSTRDWYDEPSQDIEFGLLTEPWFEPDIPDRPRLGIWPVVSSWAVLVDNYLRNLALQLNIKQKQLEHSESELERKFQYLATRWREQTAHLSSITKQVMNFNYQRIIGMGPAVLPILFRELDRKPSYWFWALEAITGENPTRPEDIGNVTKMADSWLEWARTRGYLNVSSARILLRQFKEHEI